MENSKIAWTDHTFNPWWGCVKVSEGCKNCYAETFSKRTGNDVWGVDRPRRFFGDDHWSKPLKWNRDAEKAGKRARVFSASMADVFEDRPDLVKPRKRLFELIPQTPWLDWLILTKRPENINRLLGNPTFLWPTIWLGTTIESKAVAQSRAIEIMDTLAAIKFISLEPLLKSFDLYEAFAASGMPSWVIVGGESGPKARPFDWDWARDIRDQCKTYGVPFFMKQGGGWPNKREKLEDIPEDLRIREFPK